jgi:hypothetical protein
MKNNAWSLNPKSVRPFQAITIAVHALPVRHTLTVMGIFKSSCAECMGQEQTAWSLAPS